MRPGGVRSVRRVFEWCPGCVRNVLVVCSYCVRGVCVISPWCAGWLVRPGPLKFRAPFVPCVLGIWISFSPKNCCFKLERGLKTRVKNNKFRFHFDQKCPLVSKLITNQHIFRTLTHMTDLMPYPHTPHFPQITGVFKPSHKMARSTEERFAMERMATRGFGAKKIATTLGLPQWTTKR